MDNMKPMRSSPVLVQRSAGLVRVVLNRPDVLNSLNLEMVRIISSVLDEAENDNNVRMVVFMGRGEKGFCAGGDIRVIAQAARSGSKQDAMRFFEEEYALDLRIHRYSKPVVVLADGITMGGGLGISAGADMVIATGRTMMAMPETRIGFFPDVGASGWLFSRCPGGYPEFLGLTGYEAFGAECVRLGLADAVADSGRLTEIDAELERISDELPPDREIIILRIKETLDPFLEKNIPENNDMDKWVQEYFAGKDNIVNILGSLRQCSLQSTLCDGVFRRLSERSPYAVVATLAMLRHNEGRSLEGVFAADLKAASHLMNRHDFREGVRARLIDRDNTPSWEPDTFEEAQSCEDLESFLREEDRTVPDA